MMFSVVALVIIALIWIIKGLIGTLSMSKQNFDQAYTNKTSRKNFDDEERKARNYICDDPKELIMSAEFRAEKLREYPYLVHIDDELVRLHCLGEKYEVRQNGLDVFSCFIDTDEDNIRHREDYIRHLVYQYINSIGNDDFYDTFVELLISDKSLLIDFVQECHVAESWRKECHRLYDPENYLQDFMSEHDVKKRIHEINADIKIPTDFRHRHPITPSKPIKEYINTEKKIAENKIKISELARSGAPKLKVAGFLGVIAVCMTLIWFFAFYNHSGISTALFWIGVALWLIFIFGGAVLCSDSDNAAHCQEENSRLVSDNSNLDKLSIWAKGYDMERKTRKERDKKQKDQQARIEAFNRRLAEKGNRELSAGGNKNDRS